MGRPRKGWTLRKPRGPTDYFHVRWTTTTGERPERSTGTRDPREAARVGSELYARELLAAPLALRGRVDPLAALDELMALWLAEIEKTLDHTTCTTYAGYMKRFLDVFQTLGAINPARMGDYQRDRLTQVVRGSVRKERSALNGFLAWCVEQGILAEASRPEWPKLPRKSPGVRSGKQRSKPVDVTVAQVRAFLAALPIWSRAFRGHMHAIRWRFLLAYETGLRPATIDALEVPKNWTPGAAVLVVEDAIDKSRYGRTLPLSPLARLALEETVAVLKLERGPIFGVHDYRDAIEHARVAAGLPKGFAPYDLRHGRAGHLLDASGNLRATAFLLGHRLLTTTNRYLRGDENSAAHALEMTSSGAVSGRKDTEMSSAKEGNRTPTRVTPLEPESTQVHDIPAERVGESGHVGPTKASGGQDSGARPETPQPGLQGALQALGAAPDVVKRAAVHLAVLRAEGDVFDLLWADELGVELPGRGTP